MGKSAVIYARISIATEESVSVARQLQSARQYAEARDWRIVGTFVDEGVSATHHRPEARAGWQALLGSSETFEAVIVWKVDRLARRVIDFLTADEALQARGAAVTCVEQSIDMTTGEGRAFAQMLAVFGELEASATSARMTAARAHLLMIGRSPGGIAPYGYRMLPNPAGAGVAVAQDPATIGWLSQMAKRAMRGDNVNSIRRWLNDAGAPIPDRQQWRRGQTGWAYSSVERMLRNPILAGLTLHNPGQVRGGRGREVLRDPLGAPQVRTDLAIITLAERDHLLYRLDHKAHHAAIPRLDRVSTPRTLSGLAYCAECNRLMTRATAVQRPVMKCPRCAQQVSMSMLMPYLSSRLLTDRAAIPMYELSYRGGRDASALNKLAAIEHELQQAATSLTSDGADTHALMREIADLKVKRGKVRRSAGDGVRRAKTRAGMTVAEVWNRCVTDEQQRDILLGQVERLAIRRGQQGGRRLDSSRVLLVWRLAPRALVPAGVVAPSPFETQASAQPWPWISARQAAELTGLSDHAIRTAVRSGLIERRHGPRGDPSLSRASVLRFRDQP